MKIVVFGLSISSSWGNGHATLWRGLCAALGRRGHAVVFFEKDVSYYADHRDMTEMPGCDLRLYPKWEEVAAAAARAVDEADVAMVTSYCPDGVAATETVLMSGAGLKVFYDLDTPVTLERMRNGQPVAYIGPRGLGDFDLVLSYTGGRALDELKTRLGAKRVAALYGSVDPAIHHPVRPVALFRSDLSYLGTYADDRQALLEKLFVEPARRLPKKKFVIAGAQYPEAFPWTENIYFVRHLPPESHPAFYCSSRLTLNVTRGAMKAMGYCPSGRLFEAAACGTPVVTDDWEGLDHFFEPDDEVIIARTAEDTLAAMEMTDAEIDRLAQAARERTLDCHTADQRAADLERCLAAAKGFDRETAVDASRPADVGTGRPARPWLTGGAPAAGL